jgi:hypothetical protein
MAGSDITASPSQLVARTNTCDMEDGLKATNFQDSRGCGLSQTGHDVRLNARIPFVFCQEKARNRT